VYESVLDQWPHVVLDLGHDGRFLPGRAGTQSGPVYGRALDEEFSEVEFASRPFCRPMMTSRRSRAEEWTLRWR
jgi:hypothetical protein